MPIRPEMRARYPKDWKLRLRVTYREPCHEPCDTKHIAPHTGSSHKKRGALSPQLWAHNRTNVELSFHTHRL